MREWFPKTGQGVHDAAGKRNGSKVCGKRLVCNLTSAWHTSKCERTARKRCPLCRTRGVWARQGWLPYHDTQCGLPGCGNTVSLQQVAEVPSVPLSCVWLPAPMKKFRSIPKHFLRSVLLFYSAPRCVILRKQFVTPHRCHGDDDETPIGGVLPPPPDSTRAHSWASRWDRRRKEFIGPSCWIV
ncbi:hypothetical protein BKA81DRAFT_90287 [Phyllosticta paracitricarpa]